MYIVEIMKVLAGYFVDMATWFG